MYASSRQTTAAPTSPLLSHDPSIRRMSRSLLALPTGPEGLLSPQSLLISGRPESPPPLLLGCHSHSQRYRSPESFGEGRALYFPDLLRSLLASGSSKKSLGED